MLNYSKNVVEEFKLLEMTFHEESYRIVNSTVNRKLGLLVKPSTMLVQAGNKVTLQNDSATGRTSERQII